MTNSGQPLAEFQRQLPVLMQNLQQHHATVPLICAAVALFALVQIFKGWRLHQLAEQFFGALFGALIGAIAAAAIRGLLFKTPFVTDTSLIALAVILGLIGARIGFKIGRFDVTTLARTGLTIEGDGVHTVYGIIWSHALIGTLLLTGAIFCAAAATGIIPQGREHFAILCAAILALIIGIKGAMRQTRNFLDRGP